MDRDVFGRCTRLGRQVGGAVVDALEGGPWSDFLPTKMLEDLIQQGAEVAEFFTSARPEVLSPSPRTKEVQGALFAGTR